MVDTGMFHSFASRWARSALALAALGLALPASACGGEAGNAGAAADSAASDGSGAGDTTQAHDASGADAAVGDGAADSGGADVGGPDTAGIACHPIKNTGCPQGQHCVYEGDVITCVADGEHAPGEVCDDGKGCKVGICVQPVSGKSRCAPFCTTDLQCASSVCSQLKTSKGKVCDMGGTELIACSPLTQDCQDPKHACYSTPYGFGCLDAGLAAVGEPCADDNACVKGAACIGQSGSQPGQCRKICKQGGGAPECDSLSAACAKLAGSATAGYCDG